MSRTVLSLFSGAGGFDLGLERAGFTVIAQCENEPVAQSVLRRHWPDVPLVPDVRELKGANHAADVIAGGFPCQDLSVAGKRAGLEGERSGLFHEVVRITHEMQEATGGQYPKWVVLENVPGLYSSNNGDDFATVLALLVGGTVGVPAGGWPNAGVAFGSLGSAEWRTLDSQYFGVAQRRRRVFLVYRPGGECAGEVLLEPDGVQRDSSEGESAGQDVAPSLSARASYDRGDGSEPLVAVAPSVLASWGHHGYSSPRGDGTDPIVAAPLTTRPYADNASQEGSLVRWALSSDLNPVLDKTGPLDTGNGTPRSPIVFKVRGGKEGGGKGYLGSDDIALTISTVQEQHLAVPIAFDLAQITSAANRTRAEPNLPASTLAANSDMHVASAYAVRRFTPTECERLQGFPDGWTETGHAIRGVDPQRLWNARERRRLAPDEAVIVATKIADTHRYRLMGNAVTVNVVQWIGARLGRPEKPLVAPLRSEGQAWRAPRGLPRRHQASRTMPPRASRRSCPHFPGSPGLRERLSGHPARRMGSVQPESRNPKPARCMGGSLVNTVGPMVLALLRDYRGLPLTLADIEEEIGVCECTARAVLKRLVHKGLVTRSSDPYNVHLALYRAPQDAT